MALLDPAVTELPAGALDKGATHGGVRLLRSMVGPASPIPEPVIRNGSVLHPIRSG
jgi:hypothetical protein